MRELNTKEIEQVSGGFLPQVIGGAIGFGSYAINNRDNFRWRNAAAATGFGAVSGGFGSLAHASAGGLRVAYASQAIATGNLSASIR